jgi:hypothetical protein
VEPGGRRPDLGKLSRQGSLLPLGIRRFDQELQAKQNDNAHSNQLTEPGSALNKLFDKHS